jgi:peptidoglycan/LPS O-acetylase OafA/YrhL
VPLGSLAPCLWGLPRAPRPLDTLLRSRLAGSLALSGSLRVLPVLPTGSGDGAGVGRGAPQAFFPEPCSPYPAPLLSLAHRRTRAGVALFAGGYDLPLHLLLLHNLTHQTFASLSSVCWSLALEWQLYLIFPVLVALVARRGIRTVLITTLLIVLLWQGLAAHELGVARTWQPSLAVVYHALPGRVFEFACGMLAALRVARPLPGQRALALKVGGTCLIPALVLVLFFYRLGPLCDPLWGIVFACWLVFLSDRPVSSLLSRALGFLGKRSYSIYLLHMLVMLALPLPSVVSTSPLLTGLLRTVVALCVGLAFFTVAERPFLRRA